MEFGAAAQRLPGAEGVRPFARVMHDGDREGKAALQLA